MEISKGCNSSNVNIKKKGIFAFLRKFKLYFFKPQITPIRTKKNLQSVTLIMSRREIKKVSNKICSQATEKA